MSIFLCRARPFGRCLRLKLRNSSRPRERRRIAAAAREGSPGKGLSTPALACVEPGSPPEIRPVGGPEWIRSDLYTVETTATGKPDDAQLRAMLRDMLADRYKLVVHTERRDMPLYVLTVARAGRLGPNLKPRIPACEPGKPVAPETITLTIPGPPGPPRPCGSRGMGSDGLFAIGITMPMLARAFDNLWLNDPVTDRTGLTGEYDVLLTNVVNQWTNNPLKAETDNPDAARLPIAIEDQLGLKLELRREPADVVIVDRIERPSDN